MLSRIFQYFLLLPPPPLVTSHTILRKYILTVQRQIATL